MIYRASLLEKNIQNVKLNSYYLSLFLSCSQSSTLTLTLKHTHTHSRLVPNRKRYSLVATMPVFYNYWKTVWEVFFHWKTLARLHCVFFVCLTLLHSKHWVCTAERWNKQYNVLRKRRRERMLRYFSYILVCGHSATISVLYKSKLAINLVKLPSAIWSLLFLSLPNKFKTCKCNEVGPGEVGWTRPETELSADLRRLRLPALKKHLDLASKKSDLQHHPTIETSL